MPAHREAIHAVFSAAEIFHDEEWAEFFFLRENVRGERSGDANVFASEKIAKIAAAVVEDAEAESASGCRRFQADLATLSPQHGNGG